jgi:hypothetical protein
MKFPQLCYQFKDLLFACKAVAEFEFGKNQNKPIFLTVLKKGLKMTTLGQFFDIPILL